MNTAADFPLPNYISLTNRNSSIPAITMNPAGFWVRAGATLLDGIISSIMSFILMFPITILEATLLDQDQVIARAVINGVVGTIFAAFYYGYFYSTRGATPGKMVFGLKVLDNSTGEFLTPGKAVLRETVGKWLVAVTFGIAYIVLAFRDDKRGLHDFIANSSVYKAE